MKKELIEEIKKNYKNPNHPTSFTRPQLVYKYYKKKKYSVTLKEIKKILADLTSYTLHKQYKKLLRNPTYVHTLRKLFQVDLIFISELAKDNDNTNYLLACIDCFSRFLFVRPLKDKSANSFLNAFVSIIKQAKYKPQLVMSDRGTEMVNRTFLDYCKENNMKLIHSYTSQKAFIVERANLTIQRRIYAYCTQTAQFRYIDKLQDIVEAYNNTFHTSIGMTPREAEIPKNSLKVRINLSKLHEKIKRRKPRFSVGQKVLISYDKTKFSRGYKKTSSDEIFTIFSVNQKFPIPTYTLVDKNNEKIKGEFYEYEITEVGDLE